MKTVYIVHDIDNFNDLNDLNAVAFTSETDAFEYIMSWWEGYQYSMFHYDLHWAISFDLCTETPLDFAKSHLLLREGKDADNFFFNLTITRITLVD